MDRKGKVRPEKEVKSIDCKCRYSCKNVSAAQQKILLDEYWSKSDTARQKEYIGNLIHEMPIARKRKRNEDSGVEKKNSRVYCLPDGQGNNVRVCLPFFCATFSVSKTIINDALFNRSSNGSYNGRDKRKGKPAHNATPTNKVDKVRSFLNEIPKVRSHYCRKRSSRLYLPPDLSIANLYDIYSKKENSEAVNMNVFRKIFKEFEPPLAIFLPKKDQCTVCNEAERTKPRNPTRTIKSIGRGKKTSRI